MKLAKSLLIGASALGLVASAQAQSVLRLTGSTAYRAQTHAAIQAALTPGYSRAITGTDVNAAAAATFVGTIGSTPVVIQCGWTGSVEGIRDVSTGVNNQQKFIPAATATPAGVTGATANEDAVPDVTLSDCTQGSTIYTTPTLLSPAAGSVVGIIPFRFFTNPGAPFNKITDQQIQQLYANGSLPLSFFTGNAADETHHVYAAGRANSSGTRLIMHAETGIGAFSSVNQYQINTQNTLVFLGNGGVSGSALKTYVSSALSGGLAGDYVVAYMGGSDASGAVTGGATELAYNGTSYAGDATKVQNGSYSFWGYEQFLYRPSLPATEKGIADTLAAQIKALDTVLAGMRAQRTADGGLITPTFE